MSMLELDVKLPELDGLVKNLGLEEGGRAQQHLVKNVARRITKYVPKRTYSSIENAIAQGQEQLTLHNATKGRDYTVCLPLTQRQRGMILAGGLLNYTRESQGK